MRGLAVLAAALPSAAAKEELEIPKGENQMAHYPDLHRREPHGRRSADRRRRRIVVGRASLAGMAAVTLLAAGTAAAAQTTAGSSNQARAGAVAAVRAATNRFHDLQRAENAGYGFFTDAKGIACIAMPHMGGMGVHFVKGSLVGDPAERVRHPEALVYRVDSKGMLRLSAVEYVVLVSAWKANHHRRPILFGHRFQLTKAPNRYGLPDFYSLHAWVWYHNPAGRFAMWNPRVHC